MNSASARASGGALPGLVVDDPQLAGRCDVDAVDEAAQQGAVGEFDLDPLLAALRVEPGRVLEPVVTRQQRACLVEELGPQRRIDVGGQLGLRGDHPLPGGVDQRHRGVAAALGGGQRVELLEGGVHDRPAHLRGGRRFRQPVDRAEPVQQRALLEVAGPRRRQRRTPDAAGPARRS